MEIVIMTLLGTTSVCCILYWTGLNKKLLVANVYLFAIGSIIGLFMNVVELFIPWYFGYLNEEIAFKTRSMGIDFATLYYLKFLSSFPGILNFFRRFRKMKNYQILVICGFILLISWWYYMSSFFVASVAPGWDTTVIPPYSIVFILTLILGGMLINFIIAHFEWLPELRESVNENDVTFDALVEGED